MRTSQVPIRNGGGAVGATEDAALHQAFLDALASTSSTVMARLKPIVLALLASGSTRRELVSRAAAAGYSKGYVRSLLSLILRKAGCCRRKPGAGPKTPPEALAILAFARERYGARARKLLLSAAHAAKKEDENRASQFQPPIRCNGFPAYLLKDKPLSCTRTISFNTASL